MTKYFIVSLPRTGTTSLCLHFLNLGFKVAHNAYSADCIEQADVVADTPIFNDYAHLHSRFPEAKFIYIERAQTLWLESIRRLLRSMRKRLINKPLSLESDILRCFESIFPQFMSHPHFEDQYLLQCYAKHQQAVFNYFSEDQDRLLRLELNAQDAVNTLHTFIAYKGKERVFPHVNTGRRISYWQSIEHPNKIDSKLETANTHLVTSVNRL